MASHEEVKQDIISQGKQLGYGVGELKVLSTDPYFVGTDKDYTDAKWAANLWDTMMAKRRKPLHLRGFHYWVMSNRVRKPDGNFYTEPDPVKDWGFLLHAAQVARYLGIGSWQSLVDLKHPDPSDYDNYWVGSGLASDGQVDIQAAIKTKFDGLVEEILKELLGNAPRFYESGYQLYHLEVWCEKGSMGFAIEPPCRKYGACYQPLVGQASVEKVNMSANRAIKAAQAGKKVRIFYISDWDRYGASMVSAVARKLEFFIQNNVGVDIKLMKLALNEDQIKEFNLPKEPKHGESVVELDALEAIHPGELSKIINYALQPYYDTDKPRIVSSENRNIRERARQLLEVKLRVPLEQTFEKITSEKFTTDVDLTTTLDPEFEPPEPGYEVEEVGDWMYDSGRSYFEQLEEYKKYKASRVEEEV